MAATELDSMELEAMRMDDSSWHPCRISLSSRDSNVGIVVDFGNGDEEDFIYNAKDALSRLRFRSTSLQGDECTSVKEGDCVLALQQTKSNSLFIDATVEEPKRVKHSKRVHCRCTFEIKWLNSELKGETVTLPSKSILKVSDRRIDEHPVFSSFLKALSSENGGESPILSFSEESSCEAEFVGILEKQVEEISKMVDESFSDLFLEVKNGTAIAVKQRPGMAFMQTKSPKNRQISVRKTTRSQSNDQIATEVTEDTELKPVLSPLAARAALASLVHELPEKPIFFPGEDDFLQPKDPQKSNTTGLTELSALDATFNSVKLTLNVQNRVLLSPNFNRSTNDCTRLEFGDPAIPSPNQQNAAWIINSYGSSNKPETSEKKIIASKDYNQNLKSSGNGEKTKINTATKRLTRSMQKELEASYLVTNSTRSAQRKEALVSTCVIDNVLIPKSPSFELKEAFASDDDDDDVNERALSKKLSGSTKGTGCGKSKKSNSDTGMPPGTRNKAEVPVASDNFEIMKKELTSTHMNSTSQTHSTAERNETSAKRTRLSRENDLGTDSEAEENRQAAKKNHVSSKKSSMKLPLRSSPRFACPPKT